MAVHPDLCKFFLIKMQKYNYKADSNRVQKKTKDIFAQFLRNKDSGAFRQKIFKHTVPGVKWLVTGMIIKIWCMGPLYHLCRNSCWCRCGGLTTFCKLCLAFKCTQKFTTRQIQAELFYCMRHHFILCTLLTRVQIHLFITFNMISIFVLDFLRLCTLLVSQFLWVTDVGIVSGRYVPTLYFPEKSNLMTIFTKQN